MNQQEAHKDIKDEIEQSTECLISLFLNVSFPPLQNDSNVTRKNDSSPFTEIAGLFSEVVAVI